MCTYKWDQIYDNCLLSIYCIWLIVQPGQKFHKGELIKFGLCFNFNPSIWVAEVNVCASLAIYFDIPKIELPQIPITADFEQKAGYRLVASRSQGKYTLDKA